MSRLTDEIAEVIDEVVAIYAGEKLEWEIIPMPYQTEQGPQLAGLFFMWMPTILLDGSKFTATKELPNILVLLDEKSARAIVHEAVEVMRAGKAEMMRKTN